MTYGSTLKPITFQPLVHNLHAAGADGFLSTFALLIRLRQAIQNNLDSSSLLFPRH
ncbi:hypothetical protein CCP4SC76_1830004 [Gammaproteobacteria bacterium]